MSGRWLWNARRRFLGRGGLTSIAVSLALSASLTALLSQAALAAEDPPAPRKIRTLFVDADDPSAWPKGLEPVSANELLRLLGADRIDQSSKPTSAPIERAIYSATFREGKLREGVATLDLNRAIKGTTLVQLGDPNLQLSYPRWMDSDSSQDTKSPPKEALWGSDGAGRRVLIAETGRSHFACEWSLAGRPLLGSTEFTLVLPPAVVSRVMLRVPDEFVVDCNAGVVSQMPNPAGQGMTNWEIDLGSRSNCEVRIDRKRSATLKAAFFLDQDTAYLVRAEKLQIQSKLQLDVFCAPLTSFSLAVPRSLRVETISSADVPLALHSHIVNDVEQIDVTLPEPLLGKGRTIVVEASAASRTHQLWSLPRIDVRGAVRRDGQVEVTVASPLKLLRFGSETATAQLEAASYAADGEETFKLRDAERDRPIQIEVGEPTPTLTASMLERLDLRRDQCLVRGDIVCTASGGSTFSIECELPEACDVTNVQAVGDVSRVIYWSTRAVAPHRKRVKIDFFRAISEREPQRFRIEAALPVPRTGDTINLPVLRFPGFRLGELQTVVTHSPAIDLTLDPPNEFVPLDQAVFGPPFADSPLRPDAHASTDERIVVHQKSLPNEKARITLRRGEQGYVARVQSTVDVGTSQMNQRIAVSVTPQAGPIERLFVYLTAEGPPLTWLLLTDRPRPLDAARIAPGRHSEWNLPIAGELWEIRIPEPQKKEFRLEGARKTSSLGTGGIALPFLPGARTFSGTVDVRFEDPRQFEIEALGPRPARPSAAHLPADARAESRVIRSWNYDLPTDSLVVKPRRRGGPEAVAQSASLELHSYLYSGGSGDDLHQAIFSLAPLAGTRPFLFSLDSSARLIWVSVNGNIVRVKHHDDGVTVPSLPSDRWNRVEVVYKTASVRRSFLEERSVVVPRTGDLELLDFQWRFALPPGIVPNGRPLGMQLSEAPPALSWSEKLFGPLGRSTADSHLPSFADAPWLTDFGFSSEAPRDVFAEIDPTRPAPNWTVWHASADLVPAKLALALWHEPEMRGLAWIVLLGCLTAGLALHHGKIRFWRPLGLLVIAGCAAASLVVPGLYALPLGACVSGTLLAFLIARPAFSRTAAAAGTKPDSSRLGSTVSFDYQPIMILLAIGVLCTSAARGQETSAEKTSRTSASPGSEGHLQLFRASSATDLLIVVPARGGNANAGQSLPDGQRLFYVPREALAALRRTRNEQHVSSDNVFLLSEYDVTFDDRQPPAIEARYRIALTSAGAASVRLPLTNVTLAGANACRVNGRPCPLRKEEGAYVLTLDSAAAVASAVAEDRTQSQAERQPVEALRPARPESKPIVAAPPRIQNAAATAAESPRIFEVSVSFFPEATLTKETGGFEIGMPKVTGSKLRILKPNPFGSVTLIDENGRAQTVAAGARATIDIGDTGLLRIVQGSLPQAPLLTLEARAVQFVRVSPDLVEMDCRVSYAAGDGGIHGLEWMVPAGAAVRLLGEGWRYERGTPTVDGRWAPLNFVPLSQTDGPQTLGVKLMVPVRTIPVLGRTPHFMIPLVRFAGRSGGRDVKIVSNQVGVTAVPGYRAVVLTNEPNLSHTAAADAAFRQEWRGSGRKEPDFILEARGLSALPVELTPLLPSQKVRITHEAKVAIDRLAWKTTAEIRAENAPAFVHLLRVDPRLKIESISIQEDNVERLVRFSRSGHDVTLFLRDRAAATQELVLSGSMPLEFGREVKLPEVSVVGATVTDARLLLQPDPQVDVVVTGGSATTSTAREERSDERTGRRTREYLLAPDAALPSIRVTARAEQPRLSCVTVLAPKKPEAVDVGIYLQLSGTRGEEGPFEIMIPQELVAGSTIVANVDKQIRRHADGTFGVLLEVQAANDPVVQIHWTQTPHGENWTLPRLSVTNAVTSEAVLLVSRALPWKPTAESRVGQQKSGGPEWMHHLLPAEETFHEWKSAEKEPLNWILTRPSATPARRTPMRVYTNLTLSTDGSTLGSLYLLLEQQTEPALAVRWPASTVLKAALVDGRPVQPLTEPEGQLTFPVPADGRNHRLAIHWARTTPSQLATVAKILEQIPLPANPNTNAVLLAVDLPSGYRAWTPPSFQPMEPHLFADQSQPIVNLERPKQAEEEAGNGGPPPIETAGGQRLIGRWTISHGSLAFPFWALRDSLFQIPLACGVFALVLVAMIWLARSKPVVWLLARQPVLLAIVGTAWWLWLSPRVVGIALVVIALAWFAAGQKVRKSRRRHHMPSTVHLPA